MYHHKKLLLLVLLLLIIATVFAGCRNGQTAKNSSKETQSNIQSKNGRFLENELSLPEKIKTICCMRKLSDGSLEAIGRDDGDQHWILKSTDQGKRWEKTAITGLPKEFIPTTAIAPDGTAALIPYAKDKQVSVSLAKKDGSTEKISLEFSGNQKEDFQIEQAAYDSKGVLFLQALDGTLYQAAPDGKCKKAFDTNGRRVNYFGIAGNILLAVSEDSILLFDTVQGKRLPEENSLNDYIQKNKEMASRDTDIGSPIVFTEGEEEGSILFADKEGIFHYQMGGSVIEQLMDNSMSSLNSGDSLYYDMAAFDSSHILIATKSNTIYQYTYDKEAASVPDQELTVYALDESVYLRQAVTLFQKIYPDIHINLEIGLSGKDGVTLEDALSVLNTNILAGKGPDVLILDGMPTDRYIEKGVLEDISDIVTDIDRNDGIFKNIMEASRQGDAIYAMPSRLMISVLEGKENITKAGGSLETLAGTLTELQKQSADATVNTLPLKGPKLLLRDLFYADSASWKTKDGKIQSEALTNYLRIAKQIYDSDTHKRKEEETMDANTSYTALYSGELVGSHQCTGLLTGQWKYSFGTLTDIFGLQTICSSRKKSKTDYCLLNRDRVKSFIPYLTAGVTKGNNTEAGKNFVKVLLGKKAESNESNGIPVNRAAFDEVLQEKLDAQNVKDGSSLVMSSPDSEKTYGFTYINLTQQDIDRFTNFIEELDQPAMTDRTIQNIILEQGKKHLLGEQDLNQTVDAILKKVNLYLTE